jgi:CBS domain containing-hemolysin-like protein
MEMILTLGFLVIFMVILIFLSGWFSGSETALTNLNSSEVKKMKRSGMKNSEYVMKLKQNMDKTLITILIGNNIVNIVLSSVAALIANQLFAELGVSIMIGVITFLVIIFGEITPKNSAIFNSMEVANSNARIIYFLSVVLTPLILLFRWISKTIIKMKGGAGSNENLLTTDDDIKDLVILSEEEGVIKPIEREIIHRVFKFGDRKVKDAMVKMENVFCLDDDIVVEGVKSAVKNCGFTRVPVMGDDGKIISIIYSKDLILADDESIPSLMRKPFVVRDTDEVTEVFDKMKKNRVHLAIVEDKKKNHIGIVTLEDLLEELVGELHDEYYDKKYSRYPLKDYSRP